MRNLRGKNRWLIQANVGTDMSSSPLKAESLHQSRGSNKNERNFNNVTKHIEVVNVMSQDTDFVLADTLGKSEGKKALGEALGGERKSVRRSLASPTDDINIAGLTAAHREDPSVYQETSTEGAATPYMNKEETSVTNPSNTISSMAAQIRQFEAVGELEGNSCNSKSSFQRKPDLPRCRKHSSGGGAKSFEG